MRSPLEMDTIQVDILSACHNRCGNCTRFIGHHQKPFFMRYDQFVEAVDSLADFAKMRGNGPRVGVMGGEPLLHPDFEKFCKYLQSKVPREQTGLWTCFPEGYEKYREIIAETFGNIFLNDHTRGDIMHKPVLVGSEELSLVEWQRWYMIDKCWAQQSWSASINPHGAFFCEIAASLSMLTGKKESRWKVEPGWWTRSPLLFHKQIAEFCNMCGLAMPLKMRASIDGIDDLSPKWLERLKNSPKVKAGKYQVHDLKLCHDDRQLATYKQEDYRAKIAARYGMTLTITPQCFQEPHLIDGWKKGDTVSLPQERGKIEITKDGCLTVK